MNSPLSIGPSPPHDDDAEASVLGAMLLDNECVFRIVRLLTAADFYSEGNRRIFAAAVRLHEDGKPVDAILLREELRRRGDLDIVGGSQAIDTVMDRVPTSAHALHYADIVRQHSGRRALLQEAGRLSDAARNGIRPVEAIRDHLVRMRTVEKSLATGGADAIAFRSCEELVTEEEREVPWIVRGLLARGAVTLLSGKPKAGKSTMTYSLLAALEEGHPFAGMETVATSALVLSEEPAVAIEEKRARFGLRRARFLDRRDLSKDLPLAEYLDIAATEAESTGAGLIVVDTFAAWARLGPDAEKDAGAAGAAMAPLLALAAKGPAVLLLHHARKGDGEEGEAIRGSSAIAGSVEVIIELRRLKDALASPFRTLSVLGRFADCPTEEVVLELRGGTFVASGTAGEAKSLMAKDRLLELMEGRPPMRRDDIVALVPSGKADAGRAFYALLAEGRLIRTGAGKAGSPFLYALSSWRVSPGVLEGETPIAPETLPHGCPPVSPYRGTGDTEAPEARPEKQGTGDTLSGMGGQP